MIRQHEIEFRVRYQETDAQGRVHHASYLTYFEMGRTELLRAGGFSYRVFEESGFHLVVSRLNCRYHGGAQYDDLLRLLTTTTRATRVRLEHEYRLFRNGDLIVEGHTTLACIDHAGKIRPLPDWMTGDRPAEDRDASENHNH